MQAFFSFVSLRNNGFPRPRSQFEFQILKQNYTIINLFVIMIFDMKTRWREMLHRSLWKIARSDVGRLWETRCIGPFDECILIAVVTCVSWLLNSTSSNDPSIQIVALSSFSVSSVLPYRSIFFTSTLDVSFLILFEFDARPTNRV